MTTRNTELFPSKWKLQERHSERLGVWSVGGLNERDAAVVERQHTPSHGKSDARSVLLRGEERHEDAVAAFFRNRRAIVGDVDNHRVVATRARTDVDFCSSGVNRIVKKVYKRADHQRAVGIDNQVIFRMYFHRSIRY